MMLFTFRGFDPYEVNLPRQAGVIAWHMPKGEELDSKAVGIVLDKLVAEGRLVTRQDPMLVFNYYRSKWELAGVLEIRKVQEPKPEKAHETQEPKAKEKKKA